ncbi:MAG: hypothetical protein P8009_07410 [Gammaproteobacteria bacterium]
MSKGQVQMMIYSTLVGVVGFAGLIYILVTQPAYLHATRNGVPYFSPPVINPEGGKPLDLDRLVRHYKGQD